MPNIACNRCGQTREQMAFRPFQNDLGLRVFQQICSSCWGEWLRYQQQLINHYGLNVREARAKEFLFQQMEQFLFGGAAEQGSGGAGAGGAAEPQSRGADAGGAAEPRSRGADHRSVEG